MMMARILNRLVDDIHFIIQRSRRTYVPSAALFLVVILAPSTMKSQDKDAPVLKFYWESARASLKSRDPLQHAVNYSFEARTFYKKIDKVGQATLADSTKTKYYISFGNLDSTKMVTPPKGSMPKVDLTYPNVFDSAYELNFFPNDTGGQLIGIGFDSDSAETTWPVGLVMIDRQRYFPQWLYLSYPGRKGLRHFTRSFRFTLVDGFVFADSVWEVAVKDGLISTTTYRLETGISDLKIYR